jgi:thiamine phosphate synthase YjbQ (UPF0047 family)
MTSIEVPRRLAALLPTLSVLDITDDVQARVAESGVRGGISFVSAAGAEPCCVRVNELEAGFFADAEASLARLVPSSEGDRERLLLLLLGPRTEQIPVAEGKLSLGRWQRVLLFGLGPQARGDWRMTLLGG